MPKDDVIKARLTFTASQVDCGLKGTLTQDLNAMLATSKADRIGVEAGGEA
jgi:hypothetical protein